MSSLKDAARVHYHNMLRKPFIRAASHLLQHSPLCSERFGPPKGLRDSTQVWAENYNCGKSNPPVQYLPIRPAEKLTFCHARSIERDESGLAAHNMAAACQIETDADNSAYTTLPELFVALIPQGRVWGANGAVITPDDYILGDLSLEYDSERYIRGKHTALSQLRLPKLHCVPGSVAVLTTLGMDFFAHWMMDVLPRIGLLEAAGVSLNTIDWFYLRDPDLSFQKDTLEALHIPADKIIDCRQHPHVRADMLIAPSPAQNAHACSHYACDWLRGQFLPETAPVEKVNRKLYISRAGTSHRCIVNEQQVIQTLCLYGFEVIEPQQLTTREKALLFSQAEVVLSPLGSGVANYIYCRPATTIIEFFNPRCVQSCTWAVCTQRGMQYYYFLARGTDASAHPIHEDLVVDINKLQATLALAGLYPL